MIFGYARVSTDGQTLDAQHAALRDAGSERVFAEKQSGAKTDRQQLAKAIAALGAGDTLIVTKLDRLARSTRDLLNTLDAISLKTCIKALVTMAHSPAVTIPARKNHAPQLALSEGRPLHSLPFKPLSGTTPEKTIFVATIRCPLNAIIDWRNDGPDLVGGFWGKETEGRGRVLAGG
jgi:Resolvase, N terminal domain